MPVIKIISEALGFVALAISTGYAVFKIVAPIYKKIARYFQIVSIKKIEEIEHTANLARRKARALMNLSEQAIYICKASGECEAANTALCRLFGRSEDEMLGYGWTGAIRADLRESEQAKWLRAVSNKLPYESTYVVVKDGKELKCYTKATALYDEDENVPTAPIFYVGYVDLIE